MKTAILAIGWPGGPELIVIALVALLVFGRRLPDVARSIGKSIVEFKKGIRDVTDDIEDKSRLDTSKPSRIERSTGSSSLPSVEDAGQGRAKNDN